MQPVCAAASFLLETLCPPERMSTHTHTVTNDGRASLPAGRDERLSKHKHLQHRDLKLVSLCSHPAGTACDQCAPVFI